VRDLENRIALVTGGSRGIGAAVAIALAKAGADVAVNYRERADAASFVCSEITRMGRKAIAVQADVSVVADVRRMVVGSRLHGQNPLRRLNLPLRIAGACPPLSSLASGFPAFLFGLRELGGFSCLEKANGT
jgi:hypothetical protein